MTSGFGEAADPAVLLSSLTVRYGRRKALDDVTLEVERNSVYALLGRNGAGKTSLVRCLLGHRPASQGRARVFGLDPWRERSRILQRVGVVPEEPDLPPELTAHEALRFAARLYPVWDGAGAAARLKRFEIPTRVPFRRLSKGQKGQLLLTLALAPRPELLILDDPTLGLDVLARRILYDELIGELAERGTAILITTHDLAGIEGIADRVGILGEGRLALDEPLESLKCRYRRLVFERQPVDDMGLRSRLGPLGVVSVLANGLVVSATVDRFGEEPFAELQRTAGLGKVRSESMSLEEIFIAVEGPGHA